MIEIICHGCRTIGAVNRVTAGLRCSCGSTDLDLHEPGAESFFEFMGVKTASPAHPSGGTGFDKAMPDPLKGWAVDNPEELHDMPGVNESSNHEPASPTCPVCKGSGKDITDNRNNGTCRECGGSGHLTPTTTAREPQVADSANEHRTSTPFFGSLAARIDAACPSCRTAATELVPDRREHAWWRCGSCGPLADLEANTWLNPFGTLAGFRRQPGFKAHGTRGLRKTTPDGQILTMFAAVRAQNPGLSDREALGLVRRTVAKYQKG